MVHVFDVGTLVIANGSTDTTTPIAADPHFQHADYLLVTAPTALTNTINIRGSYDGGTTYATLQIPDGAGGVATLTVGAGDTVQVPYNGFTHLDVKSGGAEGAERTFTVRAVEILTGRIR